MSYFWLSFADPDLPGGNQFLGALLVEADNFAEAVTKSWKLKLNPGGEVLGIQIASPKNFPVNKLLSRIEIEDYEKRILTKERTEG